jgi:hypothetical protein
MTIRQFPRHDDLSPSGDRSLQRFYNPMNPNDFYCRTVATVT